MWCIGGDGIDKEQGFLQTLMSFYGRGGAVCQGSEAQATGSAGTGGTELGEEV
eukprot:CAMPEP_0201672150 /NCGR_PEP_ID=MMETSP0494-20130426/31553_1 /ASSEMBLY_ACC=CAM_ASM_000839 /TAXON_ID=420259 /ORGANISM="Thalassiosira gravida, Strain GMp14c1" /LENGTH=52 /DNA_ID=CAMNT_0048153705 /DNA_START=109 /DNA_END=267 /DNA_ORIENTATION=+